MAFFSYPTPVSEKNSQNKQNYKTGKINESKNKFLTRSMSKTKKDFKTSDINHKDGIKRLKMKILKSNARPLKAPQQTVYNGYSPKSYPQNFFKKPLAVPLRSSILKRSGKKKKRKTSLNGKPLTLSKNTFLRYTIPGKSNNFNILADEMAYSGNNKVTKTPSGVNLSHNTYHPVSGKLVPSLKPVSTSSPISVVTGKKKLRENTNNIIESEFHSKLDWNQIPMNLEYGPMYNPTNRWAQWPNRALASSAFMSAPYSGSFFGSSFSIDDELKAVNSQRDGGRRVKHKSSKPPSDNIAGDNNSVKKSRRNSVLLKSNSKVPSPNTSRNNSIKRDSDDEKLEKQMLKKRKPNENSLNNLKRRKGSIRRHKRPEASERKVFNLSFIPKIGKYSNLNPFSKATNRMKHFHPFSKKSTNKPEVLKTQSHAKRKKTSNKKVNFVETAKTPSSTKDTRDIKPKLNFSRTLNSPYKKHNSQGLKESNKQSQNKNRKVKTKSKEDHKLKKDNIRPQQDNSASNHVPWYIRANTTSNTETKTNSQTTSVSNGMKSRKGKLSIKNPNYGISTRSTEEKADVVTVSTQISASLKENADLNPKQKINKTNKTITDSRSKLYKLKDSNIHSKSSIKMKAKSPNKNQSKEGVFSSKQKIKIEKNLQSAVKDMTISNSSADNEKKSVKRKYPSHQKMLKHKLKRIFTENTESVRRRWFDEPKLKSRNQVTIEPESQRKDEREDKGDGKTKETISELIPVPTMKSKMKISDASRKYYKKWYRSAPKPRIVKAVPYRGMVLSTPIEMEGQDEEQTYRKGALISTENDPKPFVIKRYDVFHDNDDKTDVGAEIDDRNSALRNAADEDNISNNDEDDIAKLFSRKRNPDAKKLTRKEVFEMVSTKGTSLFQPITNTRRFHLLSPQTRNENAYTGPQRTSLERQGKLQSPYNVILSKKMKELEKVSPKIVDEALQRQIYSKSESQSRESDLHVPGGTIHVESNKNLISGENESMYGTNADKTNKKEFLHSTVSSSYNDLDFTYENNSLGNESAIVVENSTDPSVLAISFNDTMTDSHENSTADGDSEKPPIHAYRSRISRRKMYVYNNQKPKRTQSGGFHMSSMNNDHSSPLFNMNGIKYVGSSRKNPLIKGSNQDSLGSKPSKGNSKISVENNMTHEESTIVPLKLGKEWYPYDGKEYERKYTEKLRTLSRKKKPQNKDTTYLVEANLVNVVSRGVQKNEAKEDKNADTALLSKSPLGNKKQDLIIHNNLNVKASPKHIDNQVERTLSDLKIGSRKRLGGRKRGTQVRENSNYFSTVNLTRAAFKDWPQLEKALRNSSFVSKVKARLDSIEHFGDSSLSTEHHLEKKHHNDVYIEDSEEENLIGYDYDDGNYKNNPWNIRSHPTPRSNAYKSKEELGSDNTIIKSRSHLKNQSIKVKTDDDEQQSPAEFEGRFGAVGLKWDDSVQSGDKAERNLRKKRRRRPGVHIAKSVHQPHVTHSENKNAIVDKYVSNDSFKHHHKYHRNSVDLSDSQEGERGNSVMVVYKGKSRPKTLVGFSKNKNKKDSIVKLQMSKLKPKTLVDLSKSIKIPNTSEKLERKADKLGSHPSTPKAESYANDLLLEIVNVPLDHREHTENKKKIEKELYSVAAAQFKSDGLDDIYRGQNNELKSFDDELLQQKYAGTQKQKEILQGKELSSSNKKLQSASSYASSSSSSMPSSDFQGLSPKTSKFSYKEKKFKKGIRKRGSSPVPTIPGQDKDPNAMWYDKTAWYEKADDILNLGKDSLVEGTDVKPSAINIDTKTKSKAERFRYPYLEKWYDTNNVNQRLKKDKSRSNKGDVLSKLSWQPNPTEDESQEIHTHPHHLETSDFPQWNEVTKPQSQEWKNGGKRTDQHEFRSVSNVSIMYSN